MTFCEFYENCEKGKSCVRALVPEIKHDASKSNAHIAVFEEKPNCYDGKFFYNPENR